MNDKPQIINQAPQMMPQTQKMLSQPPPQVIMNPPPPLMGVSQPQIMNQSQLIAQSQMLNQPQMIAPSPIFGQSQPVMTRNYQPWKQSSLDHNPNPSKKFHGTKPGFGRGVWKGKKTNDMRNPNQLLNVGIGSAAGASGYQPPALNELQFQNRLKARKYYPKKKFNNRFAPYAPRNTTSFIMRAKKSGGIASLVSPCPVTPAVLPTPIFSPSREVLGDMAKEEWGVDGYGSMKGLIRLRNEADNRENDDEEVEDDENEDDHGSSESDVEEEEKNSVLSRLDHEMSRFEMVYPNYGVDYSNNLENRVDDQDTHIAQLEEENLTLKERLFLMERELGDLRRRLQFLERQNLQGKDANEEVMENVSDNESDGGSDVRGLGTEIKEGVMECLDANAGAAKDVSAGGIAEDTNNGVDGENEGMADACMVSFTENETCPGEPISKDNEAENEIVQSETGEGREDLRNEEAYDLLPKAEFIEKSIGGGE
ncbi:hypothetical protein SAY87_005409 [Trapa incisa]|uniref:PRLI-interacting factor A n=1 Tax=Trapa incisa TaxID=236973 RepID=A0AAN7Q6C8_9MYRT|nr:hypothetical protein SAY87_005409 [Trapa incisa]